MEKSHFDPSLGLSRSTHALMGYEADDTLRLEDSRTRISYLLVSDSVLARMPGANMQEPPRTSAQRTLGNADHL